MRRISASARKGGFWVGLAGVLLLCLAAVPADAARHGRRPTLSISVLSGRADLVSGGSALVAINLPRSDTRQVKVTLGRRNVTRDFAIRPDGHFEGLVTGLAPGRNVLQATLRSGWATRITLVNHPIGGPVFSGPQLEPWICEPACGRQEVRPGAAASRTSTCRPIRPSMGSSPTTRPPAVRRRADEDGPGSHGAVHRADRDRLHGSRPVPDLCSLPARQAVERGRAPASVRSQAADPARGLVRGRCIRRAPLRRQPATPRATTRSARDS